MICCNLVLSRSVAEEKVHKARQTCWKEATLPRLVIRHHSSYNQFLSGEHGQDRCAAAIAFLFHVDACPRNKIVLAAFSSSFYLKSFEDNSASVRISFLKSVIFTNFQYLLVHRVIKGLYYLCVD